jgi:hypothetical protein
MAGRNFRVSGALTVADTIMERTFWIGVYPGLGAEQIAYMLDIRSYILPRPRRGVRLISSREPMPKLECALAESLIRPFAEPPVLSIVIPTYERRGRVATHGPEHRRPAQGRA